MELRNVIKSKSYTNRNQRNSTATAGFIEYLIAHVSVLLIEIPLLCNNFLSCVEVVQVSAGQAAVGLWPFGTTHRLQFEVNTHRDDEWQNACCAHSRATEHHRCMFGRV